MVHGHEREGWVNSAVDDRDVQLVDVGDDVPHVDSRAAHGVYTDA